MLASWLPSVFDSLTLVVFALIGAVELLLKHQLSKTTEIALAIVITALGGAVATVIALLVREDWMNAVVLRATRVIRRIKPSADESLLVDVAEHASQAWSTMRNGGFFRPAISSLLFLTFDLLCLRYALLAAGQHPYISTVLAAYGVPLLDRQHDRADSNHRIDHAMTQLPPGAETHSGVATDFRDSPD